VETGELGRGGENDEREHCRGTRTRTGTAGFRRRAATITSFLVNDTCDRGYGRGFTGHGSARCIARGWTRAASEADACSVERLLRLGEGSAEAVADLGTGPGLEGIDLARAGAAGVEVDLVLVDDLIRLGVEAELDGVVAVSAVDGDRVLEVAVLD